MIACPLASAAKQAGKALFLEAGTQRLSFATFYKQVLACGTALKTQYPGDGTPVLVPVTQSVVSLVELFAVILAGHCAVPIAANLPPQRVAQLQKSLTLDVDVAQHSCLRNQTRALKKMFSTSDPVLGIFTSGSSGAPKLVVHSYLSLLSNVTASNALIALSPGSRTLLSLPLFHIGGFAQVLRALLSATTVVIGGVVEDAFNLHEQGITHCSMVSTQCQRLLENFRSLPDLQAVLLGGGPCDNELVARGLMAGLPLYPSYGLSEAASQVCTQTPSGASHILNGVEVSLSAQNEILLRGKNVFLGYWHDGKLDPARDSDGWFHTRDLGAWQSGALTLHGRLDNQFISGGKNIQPEEIEQQLLLLESIVQAVVVPVPHAEFGQTTFAFVTLTKGSVDTRFTEQTISALKRHLPGYLVPRYYAPLPVTDGLKPRRSELAQRAVLLQRET